MTTFSIYKWEDGRLLLEYQNGAEHARLFFSPSSLPDLASCVSSALAEQNSRVMGARPYKGVWEFQYSGGYAGYRCLQCATWIYAEQSKLCDCDEACHSTQSTDQAPSTRTEG